MNDEFVKRMRAQIMALKLASLMDKMEQYCRLALTDDVLAAMYGDKEFNETIDVIESFLDVQLECC